MRTSRQEGRRLTFKITRLLKKSPSPVFFYNLVLGIKWKRRFDTKRKPAFCLVVGFVPTVTFARFLLLFLNYPVGFCASHFFFCSVTQKKNVSFSHVKNFASYQNTLFLNLQTLGLSFRKTVVNVLSCFINCICWYKMKYIFLYLWQYLRKSIWNWTTWIKNSFMLLMCLCNYLSMLGMATLECNETPPLGIGPEQSI